MDLDNSGEAVVTMDSIEAGACLPGREKEEKVTRKDGRLGARDVVPLRK
jgi:hypothetical protein